MQEHHWIESTDMEKRPWVLDVTHTYSRRKPTDQDLGFVVHIGALGDMEHSVQTIDERYEGIDECVEAIAETMRWRLPLTDLEKERIHGALYEILND